MADDLKGLARQQGRAEGWKGYHWHWIEPIATVTVNGA
jgi:hypothetical protein